MAGRNGESGIQQLAERLLAFSARMGKIVDMLPDTRLGRHIAGQLVRCGTAPYPLYEEACAAESRADFVHKTSLCLKELRETRAWLRLIIKSELLPAPVVESDLDECDQLVRIMGKSVNTARSNLQR